MRLGFTQRRWLRALLRRVVWIISRRVVSSSWLLRRLFVALWRLSIVLRYLSVVLGWWLVCLLRRKLICLLSRRIVILRR